METMAFIRSAPTRGLQVCKSCVPTPIARLGPSQHVEAQKHERRSKQRYPVAHAGGGGGNTTGGGGIGSGGSGGPGSFGSGGGGNLPQRLAFGFAILIAVGGYMGYRKKGSKASLKASGSLAALLLAAGYLIGGPYATAGLVLALVANLALGGYMAKGYASTKKPFPQGVFSVVSAINSVIYIKSLSSQI